MTAERIPQRDARTRAAVDELIAMVRQHFPAAAFAVEASEEDPAVTHIIATADVDDPDAVVDVVIDRMLELQIEQGIQVHLIPVRTPDRIARLRREQHDECFHSSPTLSRL